jgi:hypothetical protein
VDEGQLRAEIPEAIRDEWRSLVSSPDRAENLRSIEVLREWLTTAAPDLVSHPDESIPGSLNVVWGEWYSLTRGVAPSEDRARSIRRVTAWLNCREAYLRAGGDPVAEPLYRNFNPVNVSGVTDSVFDGVPTATLKYWLEWWQKPERTWCGGAEDGRDPAVEAARVRREVEARAR